MTDSQIVPPRLLAYLLLPVPVIGWLVAQSFTERIEANVEFTGEVVHTYATSTFAVILFISAVTNAIIVTVRSPYRPHSHRTSRYIAWQAALIILALAWLVCVITARARIGELLLGSLIAVVSIVVCVLAARPDADAAQARIARSNDRSPRSYRRITRARVLVPTLAVAAAVVALVVAQNVTTVHPDCTVVGTGTFSGSVSIYTDTCGDFALSGVGAAIEAERMLTAQTPLDISSRGFRWGLPPRPILVSSEPS